MSKVFIQAMRELLHVGPVGGWRWLSRLRRAERAKELLIQGIIQPEKEGAE